MGFLGLGRLPLLPRHRVGPVVYLLDKLLVILRVQARGNSSNLYTGS